MGGGVGVGNRRLGNRAADVARCRVGARRSRERSDFAAVKFQARPVGVDGADFHVDEAHGQADFADAIFGEIDEEL